MQHMLIGTGSGEVVALTPRQYRRIGWALHELQIGGLRLAETETPYQKYRAKRLGADWPITPADRPVFICRSSQRDMDRLEESFFAELDDAILALARHPTPRGRKRIKWLNPDLWIVRAAKCLLVYAIGGETKRLRILRINSYGKGISKPPDLAAMSTATRKPPVSTKPAMAEPAPAPADKRLSPIDLDWQDGYSGQTVEELLSFEKYGRTDLLAAAFAQAIEQKAGRGGRLSGVERVVMAVRKLDSTMVVDGFDNFFMYSSQFAPVIVDSLNLIGCKRLAKITERALRALRLTRVSAKRVQTAVMRLDEKQEEELSRCDASYWKAPGPARRLFAFIKARKGSIRF